MRKFFIIIAVMLSVALIGVGGLIAWQYYFSESPLEKTANALFPELEVLGEMKEQGSIVLTGSVESELYEGLKKPLELTLGLEYSSDATKLAVEMGSEGEALDASLLLDNKGASVSSSMFAENAQYGVRFENLKASIDESLLSPDAGGDYAMSRELYDLLVNLAEENPNGSTKLRTVLVRLFQTAEKELTVTEEKREVDLLDVPVTANVTELGFDHAFLTAFAEALLDECRNDAMLCKTVAELLPLENEALTEEPIAEVEALVELCKKLKNIDALEGSVSIAEYAGYVVLVEGKLSVTDKKTDKDDVFAFSWAVTENPDKDPRFKVAVTHKQSEKTVYALTANFERTKKNRDTVYSLEVLTDSRGEFNYAERAELTLKIAEDGELELDLVTAYAVDYKKLSDAEFEEDTELEIRGSLKYTSRSLSLTVDEITLVSADIRLFDMKKSSFTLTLSSKLPSLGKSTDATDLCTMTEEKLEVLRNDLHSVLSERAEKINTSLGVTLLQYGYIAEEVETVDFDSYGFHAYDAITRRLFVVEQIIGEDSSTIDTDIRVYDTDSMKQVGEIPMGDALSVELEADNGTLLVCDYESLSVYDARTLKKLRELKLGDGYSLDFQFMVLDGNYLYLIYGSSFLLQYNLSTDVVRHIGVSNYNFILSAAVDRESHTLCLTGRRAENKNKYSIIMFDTQTGEKTFYYEYAYENVNTGANFIGVGFSVFGHFRSPAGTTINRVTLTPKRLNSNFKIEDILYKGAACFITRESAYNNSDTAYYVYAVTNSEERVPPAGVFYFSSVQSVIPLSETEFVIHDVYGANSSFTKIQLTQKWFWGEGVRG
ncbi:MAG: hypothetical protein IJW55_06150 [Clostridia bacterium]|nr:hypothetical protein [Clostridia bacterium]